MTATDAAAPEKPTLLLVTADLFLGSRLRGLAESAGYAVTTALNIERAAALVNERPPDRALIDLTAAGPDVLARLGTLPPERIAAYAQHVRTDLLRAARAAGFAAVFTRSQLERELPLWLT